MYFKGTRCLLQETKIGKMVNDLRRKIKNEKLAKRVKQLVRNWKKLLDETAPVNGSAGPRHPAVAQLQCSPAVSPALTHGASSGRLASPGAGAGKPSTPKLMASRMASPALAARSASPAQPPRSGSPALTPRTVSPALSRKTGSPALTPRTMSPALTRKTGSPALTSRTSSPALAQKTGSPALAHKTVSPVLIPKTCSPTLAARSASPAPMARSGGRQGTSPAMSHRLTSPAVSASGLKAAPSPSVRPGVSPAVLPAVSGRVTSPLVSGGVVSPLVSGQVVSPASVPTGRSSGPGSPAMSGRQEQQSGKVVSRHKPKGKGATKKDSEGGPAAPCVNSDSSQDRVLGHVEGGRLDSDDESSCSSPRTGPSYNTPRQNHSNKASLTKSTSKPNVTDQKEVSKTNVANRKRARELSESPPLDTHKKSRLDSPGLSFHSHGLDKAINGYASKSKRKHPPGSETVASASSLSSGPVLVSSPQLSKTFSENSCPLPTSDSFLRQTSCDSRLSAQSLDRPARDKHKVKTTEQLIEDLQKKNNSSKVGNSIMTKLRTNQIDKDVDFAGSVLPEGLKPRGKRGRPRKNDVCVSVPSSDETLSQVKNELVERFLNTSDPSSPVDDYSPFRDDLLPDPSQSALGSQLEMGACSSSYSKDNFDSFSTSRQDRSESAPKDESSMDAISPPLAPSSQTEGTGSALSLQEISSHGERTGSALSLQEIYAQLPPVDYDIDWDAVDFFELPEPTPVSDSLMERLHTERLPGVNGLYDMNGDWTSWHQTITLPSFEGDQLHILPYVDLDNS